MYTTATENAEDAFDLDVHIITDVQSGDVAAACQTDDGCENTCASACASNV